MDYKEYEKYINERMRIKAENERRIKEKFSECEKWVADNLIDPVVSLRIMRRICKNKVL